MAYIATAVAAYLAGSIPFGFMVARARGVDIRLAGSGNIGATNVMRILGKPAGLFVLLMDTLKGYGVVTWIASAAHHALGAGAPHLEPMRILAAIAAVLGHNYTCWLRFKGGKGIATSLGVLIALVPGASFLSLGLWIAVTLVSGYVSVGSIVASASLPFSCWITGQSRTLIFVTAGMGALAIYKHRANIERLLHGTERSFRAGKKEAAP